MYICRYTLTYCGANLAISVYRIEKLLNPAQDRLVELPTNYLVIGEVACNL